jgi:hypothetical protein
MFQFDISKEPLSSPELKAEISYLQETRKQQIKQSCISDVLHAFVFIGLYFSGQIGGYAILVAVAISTVAAITMAMLKSQRVIADRIKTMAVATSVGALVFCTLHITMETALLGSTVSALMGLSIVLVGSTLGRNVKMVLKALEHMKTFQDDEDAQHELRKLCHDYPELEEYRELASQNLRPHLTYGELSAMRRWSKAQKAH